MTLKIVIHQPQHRSVAAALPDGTYAVGSSNDCQIVLRAEGVSRCHAQFSAHAGTLSVMDLNSSNGTFVSGVRLPSHELCPVRNGDVIAIGAASIEVQFKPQPAPAPVPAAKPVAPAPAAAPVPVVKTPEEPESKLDEFGKERIPILNLSGVPASARPMIQEIKKQASKELLVRLNLKKLAVAGITGAELEKKAAETIREILSELSVPLPEGVSLAVIEKELLQEAIGLGPLEYLLKVDEITEIMVNGPDHVYVEKGGVLYRTDTAFAGNSQVMAAIERIVSPLGRRIDESSPMVDARLADGSRVNAVIPPLSLVGPTITIRKFAKKPFQAMDLVRFGSLSQEMFDFLNTCIKIRKNIIISGGTGSGKTTLLNVLSSFLPNRERIVTIEDAAELQLHQEHLVRLESRPPNVEGKGEVAIRDLVRNALRMRPDRIVVGECRGGEALDMLQAMNTGHDGSLTTVHANSPRDALARLETLVMMAGFDLPLRAIREQIASAVHIIVQVNRERDGSRKVTHISEITKMEGDVITMQDLFTFNSAGYDDNGKLLGRHLPTGSVPTFLEDIQRARLPLDVAIFDLKHYKV